MTDYTWPTSLVPSGSEWQLVSNTAAYSSPLNGTTRTLGRGGDRWGCTLTFEALNRTELAIAQALVAKLRGQAHRVYVWDHAYEPRGGFPSSELVSNNTFASGTTGWSGGSNVTRAVTDRVMRLTYTNVTGAETALHPTPALSFTTSAIYALRAATYATRGSIARGLQSDATTYGATWGSIPNTTDDGVRTATVTAGGASGYVNIEFSNSGSAVGDSVDVPWISCARCALVMGASQTGSALTIDQLPVSTTGLLRIGDQFEVNGELKRVTHALDSDASGVGYLKFEPPLRSSPADNTPVIFRTPLCKMLLADTTLGWSNMPGGFGSFQLSLIEDIAP